MCVAFFSMPGKLFGKSAVDEVWTWVEHLSGIEVVQLTNLSKREKNKNRSSIYSQHTLLIHVAYSFSQFICKSFFIEAATCFQSRIAFNIAILWISIRKNHFHSEKMGESVKWVLQLFRFNLRVCVSLNSIGAKQFDEMRTHRHIHMHKIVGGKERERKNTAR